MKMDKWTDRLADGQTSGRAGQRDRRADAVSGSGDGTFD